MADKSPLSHIVDGQQRECPQFDGAIDDQSQPKQEQETRRSLSYYSVPRHHEQANHLMESHTVGELNVIPKSHISQQNHTLNVIPI